MNPIRVMIVEDSPVVREHLRRIISADSRLQVVAMATSGEEALSMVERVNPDVISMDIHLPGMHGLEATRRIMAMCPTPIVVVSGIDMQEVSLTMQALRAGALAVVEKPVSSRHEDYTGLAHKICTQLAIMSEVKVVRQRQVMSHHFTPSPSEAADTHSYRALGIAASTGGPNALMQVLSGLGPNFPLPILVVQHMTPAFLAGFAEWLEGVSRLPVSLVHEPAALTPGRVYLASSSSSHVVVNGMVALLDNSPPVGGHRPSANFLFSSMARTLGSCAIGVLLTGMGDDGALGMRELRQAGSFTIAEDESTAVVYGMPKAAVQLGAVRQSLPLSEIAPRVLELSTAKAGTP